MGLELARLTGAALLDHHLINDPVFAAFGADGVRPLPPEVWNYTRRIREVVFEAALAAPPAQSHIFTAYLSALPGEAEWPPRFAALAAGRGATFVPVWLRCDRAELLARMAHPERRARLKLRDPAALAELLGRAGELPAPPGAMHVDTACVSPADAARLIAAHAGALF